jgi:hypothetical protein
MIYCAHCGSWRHGTGDRDCPQYGKPLIKKVDEELERIIAEEEEIERRTEFLSKGTVCTTLGDLRGMLAAFDDTCYLAEAVSVEPVLMHGRWKLSFKKISDA